MEFKEVKKDLFKLDESAYLKKEKNDWYVIHPIKKDVTRSLSFENIDFRNYKNLILGGSWTRFFKLLLFIIWIIFMVWSYNSEIADYRDVAQNPCEYCIPSYEIDDSNLKNPSMDYYELEIRGE